MSENQIKVGDVVRLKSGGVPMTVDSIRNDDVSCVWWHTTTGEPFCRIFNPDTLEKCPPKESAAK